MPHPYSCVYRAIPFKECVNTSTGNITNKPFRLKPGDTDGLSVWYSIEALIAGYQGDFAHIAVLEISAIENIGLTVVQSAGNSMHAAITFPTDDLDNQAKLRNHAQSLAYIATPVKQSDWVTLIPGKTA